MTAASSLNPELVAALKRLKLGRIIDTLPDRLVLADKQEMTFDDLMLLVLPDEISRHDNSAADVRAREAGLDPAMRLDLWDKTSKVTFDNEATSTGRSRFAVSRSRPPKSGKRTLKLTTSSSLVPAETSASMCSHWMVSGVREWSMTQFTASP